MPGPLTIKDYKLDDPLPDPDDPNRFNRAEPMPAAEPAPLRQNPFPHMGKWYWFDETGDMSKPYPTQMAALKDLLGYCEWLDHGPTLWQSIWWPTRYYAGLFWKMLRS